MITYIFLMILGIFLLYAGGELLIRGAVSAADRLGVSPLFSGLVIVGFGTSAPELIVSLQAALQGSPDIALGNVMGSTITNTLLIIGLCAVVNPLNVTAKTLKRDGTVMLGAVVLLILLAINGMIGRIGGLILFTFLTGYLIYAYKDERKNDTAGGDEPAARITATKPIYLIVIQLVSGLILLMTGSDFLIDGAIGIARELQLSEALIGLTIVALGTSTPELTVTVMAAWRGETDIAIGNILGSNIYNILGILGITSIFSTLTLAPRMIVFDQWALLAVTMLFVLFMATRNKVSRVEGAIFCSGYVAYIAASIWLG